ncbi:transposable element Tcb1 transposase [Trichonephila clavipes]|nr:transposable element Tcb1 transposase [Trichonephila clavipes]
MAVFCVSLQDFLLRKEFQSDAKLCNKTAIITGGNTGIGKETALDLARRGAKVIIACRDVEKGKVAAEDIRKHVPNADVVVRHLNLASFSSIQRCAEEILMSEPYIHILINNAEGRVYRRGGSGRPRNTNDREDRAIRRVATSAPTTSLASIQRHLPPSRHPVPSRETIRRRLTEVGLRSRRPLSRLPLTPHHRQCRLDFCRPRATWSVTDWRRVIFSDESRFSLSADDHRTRVWRRTGQRSDPAFIVERHTAISQGVTVWGAISRDTRSSLVVLQGTLTARRYVDDILTPIVLPMLSSRPGAIYQQDNARPHTARLSQQCLQGYDVLPWPARSPDLSPIEHVCDALGRQLQPSRDTGELTAQMQRLWQGLPQGVISDLIKSMPRRISACIAARGGFTTY